MDKSPISFNDFMMRDDHLQNSITS